MPSYWWVNHKQTYRQETDGGYIWSPKANANGARNVTYDNLTRCQRGDVVFSYANGRISQLGLVETAAVTATKPPEFGSARENWSQEGWLVRGNWQPVAQDLTRHLAIAASERQRCPLPEGILRWLEASGLGEGARPSSCGVPPPTSQTLRCLYPMDRVDQSQPLQR
jgi:hypothetical protein